MPDVRTFFRHCPSCSARFEIRLVSKRQVEDEEDESTEEKYTSSPVPYPEVLETDKPSVVEVEDFRYTYKCKRCGHQWSEERYKSVNAVIDRKQTD